jgi:hypothetical protein
LDRTVLIKPAVRCSAHGSKRQLFTVGQPARTWQTSGKGAQPKRDSSGDSNAVTSVGVHESPCAPQHAQERPLRVLRWLLLISGLGVRFPRGAQMALARGNTTVRILVLGTALLERAVAEATFFDDPSRPSRRWSTNGCSSGGLAASSASPWRVDDGALSHVP